MVTRTSETSTTRDAAKDDDVDDVDDVVADDFVVDDVDARRGFRNGRAHVELSTIPCYAFSLTREETAVSEDVRRRR